MKTLSLLAGSLAVFALATGCKMLPRYARGDLQSQGFEKIPAGSNFAVRRSLATNAFDGPIARRVSESLREAGYRETSEAEADALIWYRHSVEIEDESPTVNSSEGFDTVWSSDDQPLLSCPSRFNQRLVILATSPHGESRLWQGELCSDGGGRDPVDHAGPFAREVIRSYAKNRANTRFEFHLRPPSAPQPQFATSRPPAAPPSSQPRPSAMPAPLLEPEIVPTISEAAVAPILSDAEIVPAISEAAVAPILRDAEVVPAISEAAVAPTPGDAEIAPAISEAAVAPTPGDVEIEPQPNAEPQTAAPAEAPVAPALQSTRVEPEYAEAGPTWSRVKRACASLDSKLGVGCALVVVIESGSPVLEVGYATREQATANWKSDIAEVASVFCSTATAHGVFDRAGVNISAPGQRAHRSCRQLEP